MSIVARTEVDARRAHRLREGRQGRAPAQPGSGSLSGLGSRATGGSIFTSARVHHDAPGGFEQIDTADAVQRSTRKLPAVVQNLLDAG